MNSLPSLIRFELSAARKARLAIVFSLGFAAAAVIVALIGLSAGGVLAVQGFARTTISLMQMVIWVVPLLGLLVGTSAGAESLELEFLVSLPVRRTHIILARWTAWMAILGGGLTAGLGIAGVFIGVSAGTSDAWRYRRLIAISNLLLAACLAIGLMLGLLARTRLRAVAFAVTAWVVLVIGIDLVAIGVLALLPKGQAGWGLTALLIANPVDSARVLGLALLQADIVSGPTGSAIRKVLGIGGVWALAAGLMLWVAVPLLVASRKFLRQDL